MAKLPDVIMLAAAVSLVAMALTHTDLLPPSHRTPILDIVMDETNCAVYADAGKDDCTQIIIQIRSLFAAMAAAICTISAVAASTKRREIIYGVLAGLTALKAVFHQFMYITDGDLTIPLIIVIVAAMLAVGPGIVLLFGRGNSNAG